MANPYYNAGEGRAAKVGDLFGAIARRYDLINDVQSCGLHRLWKRRLVAHAGVGPGRRALDLCCGTGDVAFALARTGAHVTGLDFSQAMLDVARARQQRGARALDAVEFVRGDALQLPFADDTFDAVTISYGLRNLADFRAGLREMLRVARPGGRMLVLDFGRPDNRLWRALYFGYLRLAVPLFGRLFAGNAAAYGYILESLRHYPGQHGVAELLGQLGAQAIQVHHLLGGAMGIVVAVKVKP